MPDASNIEGRQYKIEGQGKDGDARIVLPGGKNCFVSGVPDSLNKRGTMIYIRNFREGRGSANFATYQPSPTEQEVTVGTEPKRTAGGKDIYLLHIGPTRRADECAIAICSDDVLAMPGRDALFYLARAYDDKTIFAEHTDRRIAKGLYDTIKRAESEEALDELNITIGTVAITADDKKPLRNYFTQQQGKYRAMGTISEVEPKQDVKTSAQTIETPKTQVQKPQVMRQSGTVARKGGPGIESLL